MRPLSRGSGAAAAWRRSLLQERREAFARVLGGEHARKALLLGLEAGVEVAARGHPLDLLDCERRLGGASESLYAGASERMGGGGSESRLGGSEGRLGGESFPPVPPSEPLPYPETT